MKRFVLEDHADSFLPENKKWTLVWHDEFDGTELDRSKWGFRLNFWGKRLKTFTTEGVELDGNSHLRLHLLKKGEDYYSPHLQTGSLTYDIPKDTDGIWPFGKHEEPKFMHRYGYYEIRCRLPKNRGWHAAFWLQAPGIGSHPDARFAGVECDIMENYRQYTDGKIIAGNIWGGYGGNGSNGGGHFAWDYKETPDGWHYYSVEWSRDGYVYYFDGVEVNRETSPVSNVDQFILVSTECHGYRKDGVHDPLLDAAILPDCFVVDHVRVFDEVE